MVRHSTAIASIFLVLGISTVQGTPGANAELSPRPLADEPPTAREVTGEIERVVKEVRATVSASPTAPSATEVLEAQIENLVQCAEFLDSARYCLNFGWTRSSEEAVQEELVAAADYEVIEARSALVEETGDLSLRAMIERVDAMTPDQRVSAAQLELSEAAAGIDKYIALERLRLGSEPMSSEDPSVATRAVVAGQTFPESGAILKGRVREQTRDYWCGPATIQMMAWNYGDHEMVAQSTWADRLNTTSEGTAIVDMVRVTNNNGQLSKWVIKQDAAYVPLDIGGHTYAQWYKLNVNHYSTWGTPVILHPVLLKDYYPYLDDDGSGHFQLGRGWDFESSKDDSWQLKYYEPWNQQRFNPSEPFIARKQTRWAKNSFLANKEHFQHNIGV